jgi:hypothetical protein
MRRRLSPWAMGFANAPLGFYFGYISTAIPILLSARGVSVDEISHVSGIAFSPSFWAFALFLRSGSRAAPMRLRWPFFRQYASASPHSSSRILRSLLPS